MFVSPVAVIVVLVFSGAGTDHGFTMKCVTIAVSSQLSVWCRSKLSDRTRANIIVYDASGDGLLELYIVHDVECVLDIVYN